MRTHPRSSWSAALLAGVCGLVLAACSGDPPTAATNPTHATSITVTPNSGHGLSAVSFGANKLWPTIPLRRNYFGAADRVGGAGVNFANINSPFDLTYHGGPVITHATNINLYVNCDGSSTSCWGSNGVSPSDFLKDLNRSRFIGVVDQYIGKRAYGQFGFDSLGVTDQAIIDNGNLATQTEIFNILGAALNTTNRSGFTTIYHVFLPEGTDMCDDYGRCYSPDNINTFSFCAFHSGVIFGTDTVIYSLEPYQAVDGCQNPVSLPHGRIDATASTLSHEFFEALSDPLPFQGLSAWWNGETLGEEVADLCYTFEYDEYIGTRRYQVQSEYSNLLHACADVAK